MAKRLTKKEQEEFMKQYQQSRFSFGALLGQVLAFSIMAFLLLLVVAGIKFMVQYLLG